MREELLDILSRNRPQLVDNIDPEHGILNDLLAQNVFTRRQAKSIEVLPDPYKQVEAILDNLRRRPDEDFDKFCDILRKNGQDEIVDKYLKPGKSAAKEPAVSSEPQDDERHATSCKSHFDQTSSRNRIRNSTPEFYSRVKDEAYPMCKANRGKCLIFNVETVRGMPRRDGTDEDLRNLRELFSQLHFTTNSFTNPTAQDIVEKVAEISRDPDLAHDQCIVLFFLSHGRIATSAARCGVASSSSIEHLYGSDGEPVATDAILEPLTNARCPALRGKPKLVFFQACREYFKGGVLEADSVASEDIETMASEDIETMAYEDIETTDAARVGIVPPVSSLASSSPPSSSSTPPVSYSSPSLASQLPISLKDFVVGYSTESGHPSFRESGSGSWYINAITRVFTDSVHDMDLCAMLRKVNGIITERRPTGSTVANHLTQVASHVDSLTKPYLFFFPGIITET